LVILFQRKINDHNIQATIYTTQIPNKISQHLN